MQGHLRQHQVQRKQWSQHRAVQRRPRWGSSAQQSSVALPRSNIQLSARHVCWEGCGHTSRHMGQGPATGFCSLCPQLSKHRDAEEHQPISAHCSRVETPALFSSVGWKYLVSTNYYTLRLKNYSVAQKCNIYFRVMKTRHKAGWAALLIWGIGSTASSFTQWTSCVGMTRIVPEQTSLSSVPENFI